MVESSQVEEPDGVITSSNTQHPSDSDSVEMARLALASLGPFDEEYLSKLDDLAAHLTSRFTLSGNSDDIDEAVALRKQMIDLAPSGHSFHLGALSNAGNTLIKRFKFHGDTDNLMQALHYFEAAVASCAPDHPSYLQLVANLSSGLLNRYWSFGDITDLDHIIENSSLALSSGSAESFSRDVLFNNWATALKERFGITGNSSDLDTALDHYQSCLDLRPPGHPSRQIALANFADAMLCRFEAGGRLEDLESAAHNFFSASQLCFPGQQAFVSCLTSLGLVFQRFFDAQGDIEKMDLAVGFYQKAMSHSTVPTLEHSRLLSCFSVALRTRHTMSGNANDLDQAIQCLTAYFDITPPTNPGRFIALFNLGAALLDRFNSTSNIADLDSSIEKITSALQMCSPNHNDRPGILSLYGRSLAARFKAKGDMQDLDLATSICKDAMALSPRNGLHYMSCVANFSLTLHECCVYKNGNVLQENQTVIDYCSNALVSLPATSPAFITLNVVRAQAFTRKFRYLTEESDINTSIDIFRTIIPMIPKGHTEYVPAHLQLGIALEMRFQWSSNARDLDESISFYRIAHRSCKRENTNYANICMHLGNALRESFEMDYSDTLAEAIVLLVEAEEYFSPTSGANHGASLFNLGCALLIRFQVQLNSEDFDAAIEHLSRALTIPSPEEYLVSFALATCFSLHFRVNKRLKDLERAAELFSCAAERMPPKHFSRATLCQNYGKTLFTLGEHLYHIGYLEASVALNMEAKRLLPPWHYDQLLITQCSADAYRIRGRLSGDLDDIRSGIKLVQDVLQILPEGNPMIHSFCHTAGNLFIAMYELSESPSFLDDALKNYEKAAHYTHSHSRKCVDVALLWLDHAEKHNHSSILRAYQTCLNSLNQHLLSTASIKSRRTVLLDENWLKPTVSLATDAMACAIAQGELGLAVELSEEGRGLLWSQIAQRRTPLDALRSGGGEEKKLASDFERVSAELDYSITMKSETLSPSRLTIEEAAQRYRQLSKELDRITIEIRRRDETFLVHPSFQTLRRAALGGPVILVNASRRRCDAIIVLLDAPPRLVPLPTTLEDLTVLSQELQNTLKTTTRVGEEKMREKQLMVLLRNLWDTVVRWITDELAGFLPRGSRIWWCPSSKLTSLPLHAAGPYRKGEPNLANMYISSYTPTLSALIRSRDRLSSPVQIAQPRFVAVGQAKSFSSNARELQTIDTELSLVQSLVPPSISFSLLSGETSTAEAVLAALETHGWAHLACHGRAKIEQPFDSSFILSDRAVTVLDIVGRRSKEAVLPEFAFLSACHTAVGDRKAPDEIIHLAAAMQFAGFRSVIGTMWAVDDSMATEMVKAFYSCMFSEKKPSGESTRNGELETETEWDCTQAARALNKASKAVDKNVVTLDQRIVFIHIGI